MRSCAIARVQSRSRAWHRRCSRSWCSKTGELGRRARPCASSAGERFSSPCRGDPRAPCCRRRPPFPPPTSPASRPRPPCPPIRRWQPARPTSSRPRPDRSRCSQRPATSRPAAPSTSSSAEPCRRAADSSIRASSTIRTCSASSCSRSTVARARARGCGSPSPSRARRRTSTSARRPPRTGGATTSTPTGTAARR